jgi:hypothetical protein
MSLVDPFLPLSLKMRPSLFYTQMRMRVLAFGLRFAKPFVCIIFAFWMVLLLLSNMHEISMRTNVHFSLAKLVQFDFVFLFLRNFFFFVVFAESSQHSANAHGTNGAPAMV